jgi:predicted component of viral defense system (DUF524 family)
MANESRRTPTQILIETLDEFSVSEATEVFVIYLNEDREIVIKSDAPRTVARGMLEEAIDMIRILKRSE